MSGSRKRTGSTGWRLGFSRYPDARFCRIENLEAGATIDEIIEQFDVTREQINAVLEFAARSLDAPPLAPDSTPANAHTV